MSMSPEIEREGRAQALAERSFDQMQPAPAGGAEGMRFGGRRAAAWTGGRVDETQSRRHGAAKGLPEGGARRRSHDGGAASQRVAGWSPPFCTLFLSCLFASWRPMAQPAAAPAMP